jgi:hypothetical protein
MIATDMIDDKTFNSFSEDCPSREWDGNYSCYICHASNKEECSNIDNCVVLHWIDAMNFIYHHITPN